MGRLKALQNLNPLFSGKYKRLLEEYGNKDYSKLLLQESIQDYISYSCGQCGHVQRLQADELNSIVGHAFRLAYAAHLQKTGASLSDVISPPSSAQSSTKSSTSHQRQSNSHRPHSTKTSSRQHIKSLNQNHVVHTHSHSHSGVVKCSPSPCLLGSNPSPSCCSQSPSCCSPASSAATTVCCSALHSTSCEVTCSFHLERESNHSRSSSHSSSGRSSFSKSSHNLDSSSGMRTPYTQRGSHCKPPNSLPGLRYHDHENNMLHSPESDTSNSPTELNCSKRVGEKPPLFKDVNPCSSTCSNSLSNCSNQTSSVSLSSVNISNAQHGVVGYVNESSSCELKEGTIFDDKCHVSSDDFDLKRLCNLSGSGDSDVTIGSSLSCLPPPLPERSDSLTPPQEPHLKTAAWFQAGIPREIALEVLSREPVGAFMVRESTSKPGCYALSIRVPRDFTVSGIAHYLIVKSSKGYKIKGFTKEFPTLTALITHHSVMPELLPCPLSLSRYNPTFTQDDNIRNDDDNEDDPDYNTLSDFRKMMADLDN